MCSLVELKKAMVGLVCPMDIVIFISIIVASATSWLG